MTAMNFKMKTINLQLCVSFEVRRGSEEEVWEVPLLDFILELLTIHKHFNCFIVRSSLLITFNSTRFKLPARFHRQPAALTFVCLLSMCNENCST